MPVPGAADSRTPEQIARDEEKDDECRIVCGWWALRNLIGGIALAILLWLVIRLFRVSSTNMMVIVCEAIAAGLLMTGVIAFIAASLPSRTGKARARILWETGAPMLGFSVLFLAATLFAPSTFPLESGLTVAFMAAAIAGLEVTCLSKSATPPPDPDPDEEPEEEPDESPASERR